MKIFCFDPAGSFHTHHKLVLSARSPESQPVVAPLLSTRAPDSRGSLGVPANGVLTSEGPSRGLLLNPDWCHAPARCTVPQPFQPWRISRVGRTGENSIGLIKTTWALGAVESASLPGLATCFWAPQLPAAHPSRLLQQPVPPE